MVMDIVKPEPRTELEVFERWVNNNIAQAIGLSIFSKTIIVTEGEDV